MSTSTVKIRLWLVRETAAARRYSKLPPGRSPGDSDMLWLPRSQIEHQSRLNAADPAECIVTIPSWLAAAKGLE